MKPKKGDPELKDVLRQFLKRVRRFAAVCFVALCSDRFTLVFSCTRQVHPDLFGRYPELKVKNEFAVRQLMGILDDVKSNENGAYVAARTADVEFFVRTATPGHFLRVPASLRTTGNNCQHVLGKSLSDLFRACSLPDRFRWGTGYWETKVSLCRSASAVH
jgi:hypothetical protein